MSKKKLRSLTLGAIGLIGIIVGNSAERGLFSKRFVSDGCDVTYEQAQKVTLEWDPNSEPDLAGYKMHYGLGSRSYTAHIEVGNVTTNQVSGLEVLKTYYFAVTAYNTSGLESDYSNEACWYEISPLNVNCAGENNDYYVLSYLRPNISCFVPGFRYRSNTNDIWQSATNLVVLSRTDKNDGIVEETVQFPGPKPLPSKIYIRQGEGGDRREDLPLRPNKFQLIPLP